MSTFKFIMERAAFDKEVVIFAKNLKEAEAKSKQLLLAATEHCVFEHNASALNKVYEALTAGVLQKAFKAFCLHLAPVKWEDEKFSFSVASAMRLSANFKLGLVKPKQGEQFTNEEKEKLANSLTGHMGLQSWQNYKQDKASADKKPYDSEQLAADLKRTLKKAAEAGLEVKLPDGTATTDANSPHDFGEFTPLFVELHEKLKSDPMFLVQLRQLCDAQASDAEVTEEETLEELIDMQKGFVDMIANGQADEEEIRQYTLVSQRIAELQAA